LSRQSLGAGRSDGPGAHRSNVVAPKVNHVSAPATDRGDPRVTTVSYPAARPRRPSFVVNTLNLDQLFPPRARTRCGTRLEHKSLLNLLKGSRCAYRQSASSREHHDGRPRRLPTICLRAGHRAPASTPQISGVYLHHAPARLVARLVAMLCLVPLVRPGSDREIVVHTVGWERNCYGRPRCYRRR
jgi:hypothetical protein